MRGIDLLGQMSEMLTISYSVTTVESTSSFSLDKKSALANGLEPVVIAVNAKDTVGDPIRNMLFTIVSDKGALSANNCTTVSDGTCSVTLTNTSQEDVSVTAKIKGHALNPLRDGKVTFFIPKINMQAIGKKVGGSHNDYNVIFTGEVIFPDAYRNNKKQFSLSIGYKRDSDGVGRYYRIISNIISLFHPSGKKQFSHTDTNYSISYSPYKVIVILYDPYKGTGNKKENELARSIEYTCGFFGGKTFHCKKS